MPAPTARTRRYTDRLSMRIRSTRTMAALALLWLAACGGAEGLDAPDPTLTDPDAGRGTEQALTHLREDFDSRRNIESISSAELDLNRGALTLPATRFPVLDGEGDNLVDGPMQRNGLVEGGDIVITHKSSVVASDSLELRAAKTIVIDGEVRVGPGGMTLVAAERIELSATSIVDSKGPVRLMVADPDGTIVIAGRLITRSTGESTQRPNIEILGRGSLVVLGEVTTEAAARQRGGDVKIAVYSDVRVEGAYARISARAQADGAAGIVSLRSDAEVRITDGGSVGRSRSGEGQLADIDGAIEIQGASIFVDDDCRIASTDAGYGSAIDLVARDLIRTGERAEILAGESESGATVRMKASRIDVGVSAAIVAGSGLSRAGNLEIEASEALTVAPDARLLGGDGRCTRGGDVVVTVAGTVTVSAPARIAGGDGGTDVDTVQCNRTSVGGTVRIVAHEVSGVSDAVYPGIGEPNGETEIRIDPTLTVDAVNLAVRTTGEVRSIAFERGAEAVGRVPRLIELAAETPTNTRIVVELSGATSSDGPFDAWYPVGSDDSSELSALAEARWFRYRVTLSGRAYDAPILDFFDIDLSPIY